MKSEIHDHIPDEMKPYWSREAVTTWNSCEWWRKTFLKSDKIEIKNIWEMDCFKEAWDEWIKTENSYAMADKLMLEVDNGRYMNLISIIGNRW